MEVKNLKVIKISYLSSDHFLLELENSFTKKPSPGQFVHIKIPSLFLRRPFSISGSDTKKISILFKVIGKGSKILSQIKKGEILNVIGPIGTPFPIKKEWEKIFIVAGGTGVAPFFFLSNELIKKDKEVVFFYGAKDKDNVMFKVLPSGINFVFSTDDGSYGTKGFIDKIFLKHLNQNSLPDVIYAGGPYGLLSKIAKISEKYGIPAFVSLENRMACGTGVCYGCVTKIKTKDGWEYKKVCKDGPVFDASEVVWEEK